MLTADDLRRRLALSPHPQGGDYVETYRARERVGARPLSTAISYLLTPESFSALHRLGSDEIYHFYLGDAVAMLQLWPDGSGREVVLGSSVLEGIVPQVVFPKGVWHGLASGSSAASRCSGPRWRRGSISPISSSARAGGWWQPTPHSSIGSSP